MRRLLRTGLLALALPSLYAGLYWISPPRAADAALLVVSPGPIDRPLHLLGADFNLDGYDDLAIADYEAGTVTILINQKDGTFAPQKDSPNIVGAATLSQPTVGPLFLATAELDPEDVDGDRVNNATDDCPSVYNPADAITGLQADADSNGVGDACQSATGDTDGDGIPDYDSGSGTLDNCPLTPNPGQELETAAGLDGVCGTPDDNYFLFGTDRLCNTSDDLTSKVGAACSRNADLVVVNASSGGGSPLGLVRVRVNDGTGGMKGRTSLQASLGASHAVLADFNGDLRQDLVVSNAGTDSLLFFPGADDGEMGAVCLGGTNPGFSCVTASECPGGTCQQTIALLAGAACVGGANNGQRCAVGNNCPGGTCRVSIDPGTTATCIGGSAPGKVCTKDSDCPLGGLCRTPTGPEGLASGDFNGDGRSDLAYADQSAGNIGVFLNGGAAAFAPAPGSPFAAQAEPVDLLSGLLDGDACTDLVALSQGPLACIGGGTPGAACRVDGDCGAGSCRATRGMAQTFIADCLTGALTPGPTLDLGVGHAPRGGLLVDFDRDGKLDLAISDFTGGQVLIFAGAGGGVFTPAVTLTGLASPSAITALNYDPDTGPDIDLAVLSYTLNRVDLYRNTSTPGSLSFSLAPRTPVSPWKNIGAMAVFGADASTGQDVTLLNVSPPRLDVLSGTGFTFRGLPPEPLSGPTQATAMTVDQLRQDGIPDLLVLDSAGGTATPTISNASGSQTERPAIPVGSGPVQAVLAPLSEHIDDYDQDGVPNASDNCPTIYNPPGCPVNDPTGFPQCFVDIPCKDPLQAPVDCSQTNTAGQCDSDGNGVGDACQILDILCATIDTDLDLVPDYSPTAVPPSQDNCPWTPNPNQEDTDNGGTGDGVGNACDSSTCTLAGSSGTCSDGPTLNAFCSVDADCEAPVNDALVVNGAGGTLSFLIGDASGSLRPAPASFTTISGLATPVAAAVGRFTYNCTGGGIFGTSCRSDSSPDILVAEKASPGSGDDRLTLYAGDGLGAFAIPSTGTPQVALEGDPSMMLRAANQRVCSNPWLSITDPRFRFDLDGRSDVLAIIEPGTRSVGIFLPGSFGPVAPPGNTLPLPLSTAPVDAAFDDLNQDGNLDLLVLSDGDGDPATPNLTIYLGMGNGLFYTDPSFNPTDVPDGMRLIGTGHINLATDQTYPDAVLFDAVNQAPLILTNILPDRADIDRSGRVDGYDLAILARAFGSQRGEDFQFDTDGTLKQNPDLTAVPAYTATRVLVGTGVLNEGQDLPIPFGTTGAVLCDRTLEAMTPLYGLPVDINLDGKVDGTDLALLASRFGRLIP